MSERTVEREFERDVEHALRVSDVQEEVERGADRRASHLDGACVHCVRVRALRLVQRVRPLRWFDLDRATRRQQRETQWT